MSRIAISIGHQKNDPGKQYEWPANVSTAKAISTLLISEGFQCSVFEGALPQRTKLVNDYAADMAIECHFNQLEWPYNPNRYGSGYEVLFHQGSAYGQILAKTTADGFEQYLPLRRRGTGIVERGDLYFLKHTNCPAIIIEPLFLDNPIEAQFLKMPHGFDFIAKSVLVGITEFVKQMKAPTV